MTNQSIPVGNSPRLCLLLGTFHTVTLQSDLVLCLLYIGKETFSLELAQGIETEEEFTHPFSINSTPIKRELQATTSI